MQKSDTFKVNALMSFSGGLQDAYTFNVRGKVFANAQTGNVVLMSQNYMLGNWAEGTNYLFPIVAFVAGVFLAEVIENKYKHKNSIHWRQVVLSIEILLLFIVGLMPIGYDLVANMLVSFSCAMQVHSFREVLGRKYASTMCIGNLKSGTESIARYILNKDRAEIEKALIIFRMIFIFAIGAGLGGVLSLRFGNETIWLSSILLLIASVLMRDRD